MRFLLLLSALAVPLLSIAAPTAAGAQDLDPVRVEKRVGKLESEMRAVQRKVFPGGDPRYFEPEIAPPVAAAPEAVGSPASQPLVDLAERVGQLEAQLRTMTGQVEANQFKMRQLEEAQAKLRGDVEFRLNALEGNGQGAVPGAVPGAAPPPGATAGAAILPPGPIGGAPVRTPARPPVAATADAAWKAAYAEALAKDWPGTEAAMTDFIAAWPKSTRIAQAQYWLGRSHAERAQHAEAARAYLELYKTAPRDARAPDALVGLATAMNGLKKPKDACRVLGELDSVYGAKLTAAQQAEAKALRARAKCTA
ncbi:YbgF trimerization domain-containing protein [Sandarakinorhabdus sp. DWP1-3-1]|uniref:YbgF trimerization domain-containing protein n=1 Tax=Sandarakinorhabdus sp. DWP1-3-1 TaxID=2804627 RepID=UPI003CF2A9D3